MLEPAAGRSSTVFERGHADARPASLTGVVLDLEGGEIRFQGVPIFKRDFKDSIFNPKLSTIDFQGFVLKYSGLRLRSFLDAANS